MTKREKLQELEKKIQSNFDQQTAKIESVASNPHLKKLAIAGAGALIGFIVYKVVTMDKGSEAEEKKGGAHKSTKNNFTADLISKAVKSFLPYLIDKLKTEKETAS